jgi:hypothetical protein
MWGVLTWVHQPLKMREHQIEQVVAYQSYLKVLALICGRDAVD